MALSISILTTHPLVTVLFIPTTLTLYILAQATYNLFFHPLRKYPGPLLGRASRVWCRIGNFQGRKSERIHKQHLKYGEVIRISPNELSFSNPGVVREIYLNRTLVKEERFYRSKRIFHENHLMSFRNVEAHHQRRKLLSKGFSQAAMADFEPSMAEKIRVLLDQWARRAKDGAAINVFPWVHWLGFDTIYDLMFGEDPGTVKTGEPHVVMKYIRSWRPTYIYKEVIPQLEQWGPYVPGNVGHNFRNVQTWKNYAVNLVRSHRETKTKTPFLSNVIDGDDAYLGRPLSDGELAEECMGGMFGGSGTTANTFIYILWGCLHKSGVVRRLKNELTAAFPDQRTIPDSITCRQLPYLQSVIKETLRRYPTIIATLPRTATEDVIVGGELIPKGTVVGTQNYTIHRYEGAFTNAEEFLPERWLDKEGENARMEAFTPFSVGPRKCIASNLAEMELSILTAAFFRRFDASIDSAMAEEDMRMVDTFNAGPVGARLLLRLTESSG